MLLYFLCSNGSQLRTTGWTTRFVRSLSEAKNLYIARLLPASDKTTLGLDTYFKITMDKAKIHKDYERDAKAFAHIANHLPPRIVESAYQFSIKHSNTPTEQMELDFCPKQWRSDRNFVDILANPEVREFIFDTVAYLAQFPDKTRTLLKDCNLDATAEDEKFRKQIFYMICMALVSVVFVKKHLAFQGAGGLN